MTRLADTMRLSQLSRGPVRTDTTWNCGRIAQSPRQEYTAAAFAEPLKRVFTGFYRPTHEVSIDVHPVSPYFVRGITLRADFAPWMEQTLYTPIIRAVRWVSGQVARLQTGSIHLYLAFLPGALLVLGCLLALYNLLSGSTGRQGGGPGSPA